MLSVMSRYYNFVFTSFDLTFVDLAKDHSNVKFVCYGLETCPSTSRQHHQGYLGFNNAKSLKSVIKTFPGPHFEVMKGKMEDNIEYCSKASTLNVYGDPPQFNVQNGKDELQRWDRIKLLAKCNQLDEIESQVYVQNYNTLKRIAMDHMITPDDLSPGIHNYWIYGPPGTGKSRCVRDAFPRHEIYDKTKDKDWSGYQNEPIVLIDDMGLPAKCVGELLKRWADIYSFPADVKYSKKQLRPKRIIVTSNYSIGTIFAEDDVLSAALERRFVIIEKLSIDQNILFV